MGYAIRRLFGKNLDVVYYSEMTTINSHATLRRLWIAEGERRGYVLG